MSQTDDGINVRKSTHKTTYPHILSTYDSVWPIVFTYYGFGSLGAELRALRS